jgi:hypothetical protein
MKDNVSGGCLLGIDVNITVEVFKYFELRDFTKFNVTPEPDNI